MKLGPALACLVGSVSFSRAFGLTSAADEYSHTTRELRMMMKKKSNGGRGGSKGSKGKSSSVVVATAVNDNFEWDGSGPAVTYDVAGNDINKPAGYTVEIVVPPRGGTLAALPDGSFAYTRTGAIGSNSVSIDQFQYRICDADGENCSNTATAIIAAYYSYDVAAVDFDRRFLFALLEGEERHRHLTKYETLKNEKLAHCMVPQSVHYGTKVTEGECLNPDNQKKNVSQTDMDVYRHEVEPWAFPMIEGATLLASDPGIWSIDEFLTQEESDKLLELMKRNGQDKGLFGPCTHKSHSTNPHPNENKVCFKISTEHACEGPYNYSDCDAEVDPQDSALVDTIIKRFNSMWSVPVESQSYLKFHHSQGDTPPVDLHLDAKVSISFVLYLQDGGAATWFPFANNDDGLSYVPKKGSALAWLNVHSNRSIIPTAYHAVQAHPASMGERSVALLMVDLKKNSLSAF